MGYWGDHTEQHIRSYIRAPAEAFSISFVMRSICLSILQWAWPFGVLLDSSDNSRQVLLRDITEPDLPWPTVDRGSQECDGIVMKRELGTDDRPIIVRRATSNHLNVRAVDPRWRRSDILPRRYLPRGSSFDPSFVTERRMAGDAASAGALDDSGLATPPNSFFQNLMGYLLDCRSNARAHRERPARGLSTFSKPQQGGDAVARNVSRRTSGSLRWSRSLVYLEMTPSCCIRPRKSSLSQTSATLPSVMR